MYSALSGVIFYKIPKCPAWPGNGRFANKRPTEPIDRQVDKITPKLHYFSSHLAVCSVYGYWLHCSRVSQGHALVVFMFLRLGWGAASYSGEGWALKERERERLGMVGGWESRVIFEWGRGKARAVKCGWQNDVQNYGRTIFPLSCRLYCTIFSAFPS